MVKGMVNMVVWFWGKIRVEVDSYVICLVNIPEGIEGCFDVVHNGMAIVDQEEGHDWSEYGPSESIKPVEDPN